VVNDTALGQKLWVMQHPFQKNTKGYRDTGFDDKEYK